MLEQRRVGISCLSLTAHASLPQDSSCIIVIVVLHVIPKPLSYTRTRIRTCRAPRQFVPPLQTISCSLHFRVSAFATLSIIPEHASRLQSIKCRTKHAQHVQCGPRTGLMSDDANHTRSNAVMLSKLFLAGSSLAAFGTADIKTLKVSSFEPHRCSVSKYQIQSYPNSALIRLVTI